MPPLLATRHSRIIFIESHTNASVCTLHFLQCFEILVNIGRPEGKLTDEELNAILREAGCTDHAIPVDKMFQLM